MKSAITLPLLWGLLSLALAAQAQPATPAPAPFYLGADLSYVNEMLDCGAVYRARGEVRDPFEIFAEQGANLVRVRKWHNPDWTAYSDFDDVAKTIARSRAQGMPVLLDFHYSDTWADPERQIIPAAWAHIDDPQVLARTLYRYTYDTLARLHALGLTPHMVQVGNETNIEILQPAGQSKTDSLDWPRNILLLNSGLQAVRDFSARSGVPVQTMIHIAQPENALIWFAEAQRQGLADYDLVGLSYYPKWSEYGLGQLSGALRQLQTQTRRPVLVVETAYPWTLKNYDQAGNVLGEDSLLADFPATPEGQLQFLLALTRQVAEADALGVIYWEPAWLSTDCPTLWGVGSHWENAGFFDLENHNDLLPAFEFFRADYGQR